MFRLWALALLLFGLIGLNGPASAQRGDDGEYLILQAHYGTPRHHVDVTQRLKEMARRDRSFRMGNDTFGVDPDPGRVKTLRIYARGRDGQTRTFDYIEGHVVDGSQFSSWGGGGWGQGGWSGGWGDERPSYAECGGGGGSSYGGRDDGEYEILQARYGTPRQNVDVTQRLKELARRDRSFRMGNDTFGVDPAPNLIKTLRIEARDRQGRTQTLMYEEGQVVDGAQFRGWSGGNWGHGGGSGGWGSGDRDDDGQYQILQARYGTPRNHVDVTQRLKELARQDRRVRMGNSTFGTDPDPGHVKTLRIFARDRSGQTRTFEYTEGSVVDGAQFTGWGSGNWGQGGWGGGWGDCGPAGGRGRLDIVSASYGVGSRQLDVTQRLRSQVRDGRIDLRVDNGIAGYDPAPNRHKVLVVRFRVDGGSTQTRYVSEDNRLSLP